MKPDVISCNQLNSLYEFRFGQLEARNCFDAHQKDLFEQSPICVSFSLEYKKAACSSMEYQERESYVTLTKGSDVIVIFE